MQQRLLLSGLNAGVPESEETDEAFTRGSHGIFSTRSTLPE